MPNLPRTAAVAALVAGAAWAAKFAVITATDSPSEPLTSVLFIAGLVAQLVAGVLIAWHVTRALHGAARVLGAAAVTVGIAAASSAVQLGVAALVGARYGGGNLGIEQEAGTLVVGLVWIAVALAGRSATIPAWSTTSGGLPQR